MSASIVRIAGLVVLTGILAGCDLLFPLSQGIGPSPAPPVPMAKAFDLAGTAWTVVGIDDLEVPPDAGVELSFTPTRVSGSSGCNTFEGDYGQQPDSIKFGRIATTKIGCDGVAGARERALYGALPEIITLRLVGGDLVLLDAGGRTRIHLRQGVGIGG